MMLVTMQVESWITPRGLLSTQRTFLFGDRLIFNHLASEEQLPAQALHPTLAGPAPPCFPLFDSTQAQI
jgi:hypothetical protein